MLTLVLLALGLMIATWFLWFVLQRGFTRGIAWFDDRNAEREAERRRARLNGRATNPSQHTKSSAPVTREEDEEWAEYIDV